MTTRAAVNSGLAEISVAAAELFVRRSASLIAASVSRSCLRTSDLGDVVELVAEVLVGSDMAVTASGLAGVLLLRFHLGSDHGSQFLQPFREAGLEAAVRWMIIGLVDAQVILRDEP